MDKLGMAILAKESCCSPSSIGQTIGANVKTQQIELIFSIIVVPTTFLGCVYYPWALPAKIRWLQLAVLFHLAVYMSERPRAVLTPGMTNPKTIGPQ